jgi:hypothetical protein
MSLYVPKHVEHFNSSYQRQETFFTLANVHSCPFVKCVIDKAQTRDIHSAVHLPICTAAIAVRSKRAVEFVNAIRVVIHQRSS